MADSSGIQATYRYLLFNAQQKTAVAGILIGKGVTPEEAVRQVGTVEGYVCTKNAWELSKRMGIEMPITEQLAKVLFEGEPAANAIKNLMGRLNRNETESGT